MGGKAFNHDTQLTGMPKGKRTRRSELTSAKKKFVEEYAKTDNGAESVRRAYPELKESSVSYLSTKASRLLKNEEVVNHLEYQKKKLEKMATKAVERVEQLIQSDNEMVATTNAWKTIEQVQGKATQKTLSINATSSIEDVLQAMRNQTLEN